MTISIFNKMAAARSPCTCFKTRVLHFRVKNTPLKNKKWKPKVQKNAQLSFCGVREAFNQEIVLPVIQPCFLHDGMGYKLFSSELKKNYKLCPDLRGILYCSADFTCMNGSTIQIVFSELL